MNQNLRLVLLSSALILFGVRASFAATTTHRYYLGSNCILTEITIDEDSGDSITSTMSCHEYDERQERRRKIIEEVEKKASFKTKLEQIDLLTPYQNLDLSSFDQSQGKIELSAWSISAFVKKYDTIQSLRDFARESFLSGYKEEDLYLLYKGLDVLVQQGYGSAVMTPWEGKRLSSCIGYIGILTFDAYHHGKPIQFGVFTTAAIHPLKGRQLMSPQKAVSDYCSRLL